MNTMLESDQIKLNVLAARMLHNLTATSHIGTLRDADIMSPMMGMLCRNRGDSVISR